MKNLPSSTSPRCNQFMRYDIAVTGDYEDNLHLVALREGRNFRTDVLDNTRAVDPVNERPCLDEPETAEDRDVSVDGVERSGDKLDEDVCRTWLRDRPVSDELVRLLLERDHECFLSRGSHGCGECVLEAGVDVELAGVELLI